MHPHELKDTLAKLHEELEAGPDLDTESRERLSLLLADIQTVLARNSSEAAESKGDDESLGDRLQDAVTDFEANHPQFSQLIGRIADGLSNLGI